MAHENKAVSLPKKIERDYAMLSILSLHENAVVLAMEKRKKTPMEGTQNKSDSSCAVLKIIHERYFDNVLYNVLQSLHHPFLLLPSKLIRENNYVYAFYPKLMPFSEYLAQGNIPFSLILRWIKFMDDVVSSLHNNNIIHGDISPSNIFLDMEKNFYLGDFSSGKFLQKSEKNSRRAKDGKKISLRKEKILHPKKTGTTFFSSSNFYSQYLQDIYSFLSILLRLTKTTAALTEEKSCPLLSLQRNIEKLLRDLTQKNQWDFSFHAVCRDILSFVEENQLESLFSDDIFFLAQEDLHFLEKATEPVNIKSSGIMMPLSPAFCGLAFCITLFLASVVFCTVSSQMQEHPPSRAQPVSNHAAKQDRTSVPDTRSLPTPSAAPSSTNFIFPSNTPNVQPSPVVSAQPKNHVLDISHKKYHQIPSGKEKDLSKKIIFAENNRIDDISQFKNYSHLEELYLDGNFISQLNGISKLKHLSVLGLSNNRVTDVTALRNITSLTLLDLSYQKNLSGLISLGNLKNLEYLILTGTDTSEKEIQALQRMLPGCTILY